jgi:hypothetical protein
VRVRAPLPLVAASTVLVGVLALAALLGHAPASAAAPQRLMVSADEFGFVLSRQRLRPGRALVQLLNRGEDDHDLRLRRAAGKRPAGRTLAFRVTMPGELTERSVRLSRGRYRLWCSLPGHRALGMRATLRVAG